MNGAAGTDGIAKHAGWLEQIGEVELIGGWAEVHVADDFADAAPYQFR